MGRKANLENQYRYILSLKRSGSYSTKLEYARVMKSITQDLCKKHIAPKSWDTISAEQVEALVVSWKREGSKTSTIINKLGILRQFLKLGSFNTNLPTNRELELFSSRGYPTPTKIDDGVLYKLPLSPITRTVIDFQMHFGLTRSESIKIIVNNETANSKLIIYRDAAHNHKDRYIPVTNKLQQKTIENRIKILNTFNCRNSLVHKAPLKTISSLCACELAIHGVTVNGDLRSIYAKKRFNILIKNHGKNESLSLLRKEFGCVSDRFNKRLIGWISE